jgi:hypothetical protein
MIEAEVTAVNPSVGRLIDERAGYHVVIVDRILAIDVQVGPADMGTDIDAGPAERRRLGDRDLGGPVGPSRWGSEPER